MKVFIRRFAGGALAALLVSCSGGGALNVTPGSQQETGGGLSGAHKRAVKASIRISIPKHKHHRRILVRGHYISPATQSIAIAITPQGGSATNLNADLTPATNPDCVASLISPLVCTISVELAPGTYTASFSTYDGLLSGGNAPNNPPTGNELSANQNVPLTIVAGATNQLSVVLDGIPTSVVVLPLGSAMSGNASAGYTVSKCITSAKMEVLGLDADGNAVLGTGAPVPALASNDTTHLAIATPSPNAPNTFTLSRPNIPNAGTVVALTASVTPQAGSGGSVKSASVNVTFNGDICGVITEFTDLTNEAAPTGITAGPDGNLWFTECVAGQIAKITTSGAVTEYDGLTSGPVGITTGPDGNLWFTEERGAKIGTITTSGVVTEYTGLTTGSNPTNIVTGSDGNLWFTERAIAKIGKITTAGAVTEYGGLTASSSPQGIALGPDGNIWFAECGKSQIGKITIAGAVTEYATGAGPTGITPGPDGNLWFTEANSNRIGRSTTSGTVAQFSGLSGTSFPGGITSGPDGNLWFVETDGNRIGKVTTSGAVTEYLIPTANSEPIAIVTGPDGNLWFTERFAGKIGRMQ